ncbi:MAG: quinohemoprotein amine dehydrogenase subunit alpha [Alphaproteobacteria bacterium]|nr:MAG: quinohemoprotein amine dehydrogenase subunit alpha [Alphaproteobacteria bacterium]
MRIYQPVLSIIILSITVLMSSCSEQQADVSNVSETEMRAGQMLLSDNCSGCHMASEDGTFSRISHMRKTPEGWDMNIARMMIFHGLEIEPDDRRALVKFLSDTQGLAPSETAAYRDVLERKHNIIEQDVDPDLAAMCARCHSFARVALQRRDRQEWQNLVHMHLGQWASIEYQMLARERDWRADALGPVSEKLGRMFPLKTTDWSDWQATEWKDMSGEWRMVGHLSGQGDMEGMMQVTALGSDKYQTEFMLNENNAILKGTGKSIVHSGYEWRGTAIFADEKVRQIWAASPDGNRMTGRFFRQGHPEEGMEITAWRKIPRSHGIMSIIPSALRVGVPTEITISGVNLSGAVAIAGAVVTVKEASTDRIILMATAEDTTAGQAKVTVGEDTSALAVYAQVDYLKIIPEYGISRVGGGPLAKVKAQFEAVGYSFGPDGLRDTGDDVRLGMVPVTWATDNYNAAAAAMEDAKYAGEITQKGTFIPAAGGPNPCRKYSTNNAGDLKVIATYTDGNRTLTAQAHLIATVQRWNNPPIM